MRVPLDLTQDRLLKVKISECGEEMVDIRTVCPRILVHKLLLKDGSKPLVRKTVAQMLNRAAVYVPEGVAIIVRDAYRPISIQKKIYKRFLKFFIKQHPNWSKTRIKMEVDKFVADPNSLIPTAHSTGAAIDVSLAFTKSGKRVPMKTSKLNYQEQTKTINGNLPPKVQKNRELLLSIMTEAGFINYPFEWWHYSWGETFAAARNNEKLAIYDQINF